MKIAWVPFFLVLLLPESPAGLAQQTQPGQRPDAHAFLDGVLKRYATAKTYHIEFVEESQLNSELKRIWERRSVTAVLLPDKRYRFEAQSDIGWLVQISDGVSEWIYLPRIGQYTKGPAPTSVPGPIPKVPVLGLNSLLEAQRILGKISTPRLWIRSATYLPDEKVDVNGRQVFCTVVQSKGVVPWSGGLDRNIYTTFTFWIGKKDGVIWKETEHREGAIYADLPRVEYALERTVWFKISEPDAQSAPEELFLFKPAEGVAYVKEFASPRERMTRDLKGKQVPAVDLQASDGSTVSLRSFQGKPVLLDFWATWCVPCVESLPGLEKLYRETAGKGLVVLSLDSDEEPRKAADFLAKRKAPWANFHLTDEVAAAFPEHGIPYFVLVDSSGKVVYSWEGLDEDGLRAAVAKLGPEFADVKNSQP